MKTVMKIVLIAIAVVAGYPDVHAQKAKKKSDADLQYIAQKREMDEKRNRETELKRKNDSIKQERYVDSLAELRRSDSIRYSKIGAPDTVNPPGEKKDSLYKDAPPRMDKGTPPKEEPKGPNPGVRNSESGLLERDDEIVVG